jgi:2-C-methyl-D-erythritol 4-phosphate cytidylyltransferase
MGGLMVKEYFLTYRHVNGQIIRKQLTEYELQEVYESPFVKEVVAVTPIDFKNFLKSLAEHGRKEQEYILRKR